MASELLFSTYKCTNCQEPISGVRVQCHVCEPDIELCLFCFAAGAEIGNHKNSHAYQFHDPSSITIFPRSKNSWSALELIRLLKAVEHFGFGNWDDIAKDIETKTAEDAKEEYINKFLNGTIGRHTQVEAEKPVLIDHTLMDDLSMDELQVQKFSESSLDITFDQSLQLGYMPNRDDFEREYDPTAEQLVSNLQLSPEDDEIDACLKLAQVDIYNRRLKERARKKKLVREYKLINDFFRKLENGKSKNLNQTKDERGLRLSLKNFRQFYTNEAFERLIGSLEKERVLRVRLTELCRYRWNGLTRIDECDHFERHAAVNQSRNTGPFGHGKTLACLSGSNGQLKAQSGYVRHILAGSPKRSHFTSSRRQNGHANEISSAGCNGNAKKRRRRKGNKLKFHRPKIHAAHRTPALLRRIIQQQKLLG